MARTISNPKLAPRRINSENKPLDLSQQAADPRIQLALTLLRENTLAPGFRIKEIAARLHISSSHLRHLFKNEVGIAPTHYVRVLRLGNAKELLESTFLSVKEVMAEVGFADVSHFVRGYKKQFGETPSQTRALARKNLDF